jgi:hypothetical protein
LIQIATHPELNRIALLKGIDAPYLIWCVLRDEQKNNRSSGHYTKYHVKSICKDYGLNYTPRHFKRIFKAGDGLLWGLGDGTLHMRSFKRVYSRLADDTAKNVPSAQFIKIDVHKSSQDRRTELYYSWFVSRGEVTIARETLTEIFGLSADQQRAYEKNLGSKLLKKSNYAHIGLKQWQNKPFKLPDYYYTYKRERFENNTILHELEIVYQLPNTFIASNAHCDVPSSEFAPRRALNVTRMLYETTEHSYQPKRYFSHPDQWHPGDGLNTYIRTYYQGKKRIYRIGHYYNSLLAS